MDDEKQLQFETTSSQAAGSCSSCKQPNCSRTNCKSCKHRRQGSWHYGFLISQYISMLALAATALGLFASTVKQVHDYVGRNPDTSPPGRCILFASNSTDRGLELGNSGACGFVLAGQAVVLLVIFAWLLYTVAMATQGTL